MKKYFSAFGLLIILATTSAVHAQVFNPAAWISKGTVSVNSVSEDGLVRILLGRPFVAYTGLTPNIRVVSSTGEVPYVLDQEVGTRNSSKEAVLSDFWAGGSEAGIVADVGSEGALHDSLRLNLSSSGTFKKQVSVYVSSEKYPVEDSRWRLVSDSGYVWSYRDERAGFFASNTEVSYPKQSSRYIKLKIHSGEGVVNSISSIRFQNDIVAKSSGEESFQVPAVISQDASNNESVVSASFDQLEMIKAVALHVQDKNFNRRVAVTYVGVDGIRRSAQAGYIFSVSSSLFSHNELTIRFGEGILAKNIELRIINENNKPVLLAPQLTIISPVASIIAKIGKPGDATVYLEGRESVPRYDLASLVGYANPNIPEARAMRLEANPKYEAPKPPEKPFTENRIIFVPLMLLAVLILGGFTYAYFKKLKTEEPDRIEKGESELR